MRKRVDSDDLYDGVPDAGSQREEESYDEAMSEEEEGDLSDESEEVPLSLQASRRSEREAARKKIDYSKQAEYNEEDEDMSEGALSDSESEQSVASTAVTSRVQRNKSGRGGSKGKRSSGPSTSTQPILLDDDSEEEFIEGGVKEEDLRPEQFHCRVCDWLIFRRRNRLQLIPLELAVELLKLQSFVRQATIAGLHQEAEAKAQESER